MADLDRLLRRDLVEMHTYARPHGSACENDFRRAYILPFEPIRDPFGNLHVTIGDSKILFSCHTDTVARQAGRQGTYIDGADRLRLTRRTRRQRGSCLGADDTVGVFLMREMIMAGVPGHYVFHYGEEAGCLGSRKIAEYRREWLQGFSAAVAFDRKGRSDVISHQCGSRTASDEFTGALAKALNGACAGFTYAPSDRGLYTDTNQYADDVPECTNVSIGYENAHGSHESVDVAHVLQLREALLTVDWQALPIVRDPAKQRADEVAKWESWRDYGWRRPMISYPRSTAPVSSARPLWASDRLGGLPTADELDEVAEANGDYINDEADGDRPRDPFVDVIFLCESCGLEYFVAESDAVSQIHYCSKECEEFNRR